MGSRRVPDNDVRGTAEAFYRLQGALGLYNSLAHSTSVDEDSYKSDCHMIGIYVLRVPMFMLFVFVFCLALVEELHQSDPRGLQDGAILK